MPVKARDNEFSYPSLSLSLYAQVNLQSRLPSACIPSASASPRYRLSLKEIKYSTARIKFQLRDIPFVFTRELKLYRIDQLSIKRLILGYYLLHRK